MSSSINEFIREILSLDYNSVKHIRHQCYRYKPLEYYENCMVKRLIDHYHIPVNTNNYNEIYVWNGKIFNMGLLRNFDVICHEIAHYVLYPYKYRKYTNCKLNSEPNNLIITKLSERISNEIEEILAEILGLYYQWINDYDIELTSVNYGINGITEKELRDIVDMLMNLNIIDMDGNII